MTETVIRQIQIDLRRKQPLSEQIREEIRRSITTSVLLPGDPLPTVRQLAIQLKVNFNTVARAYRALDLEGLIVTRQGRGTFVMDSTWDAVSQPTPQEQLEQELQHIIAKMELAGISREETLAALMQALNQERKMAASAQPLETARSAPRKRTRRKTQTNRQRGMKASRQPNQKRIIRKTTRRMIKRISAKQKHENAPPHDKQTE